MIKVGIVIDGYKLATFQAHLKAAGYTWEENNGVTKDTYTLVVQCNSATELEKIVRAANTESHKEQARNRVW